MNIKRMGERGTSPDIVTDLSMHIVLLVVLLPTFLWLSVGVFSELT